MATDIEIVQQALDTYYKNRGSNRKQYGNHPAITALEKKLKDFKLCTDNKTSSGAPLLKKDCSLSDCSLSNEDKVQLLQSMIQVEGSIQKGYLYRRASFQTVLSLLQGWYRLTEQQAFKLFDQLTKNKAFDPSFLDTQVSALTTPPVEAVKKGCGSSLWSWNGFSSSAKKPNSSKRTPTSSSNLTDAIDAANGVRKDLEELTLPSKTLTEISKEFPWGAENLSEELKSIIIKTDPHPHEPQTRTSLAELQQIKNSFQAEENEPRFDIVLTALNTGGYLTPILQKHLSCQLTFNQAITLSKQLIENLEVNEQQRLAQDNIAITQTMACTAENITQLAIRLNDQYGENPIPPSLLSALADKYHNFGEALSDISSEARQLLSQAYLTRYDLNDAYLLAPETTISAIQAFSAKQLQDAITAENAPNLSTEAVKKALVVRCFEQGNNDLITPLQVLLTSENTTLIDLWQKAKIDLRLSSESDHASIKKTLCLNAFASSASLDQLKQQLKSLLNLTQGDTDLVSLLTQAKTELSLDDNDLNTVVNHISSKHLANLSLDEYLDLITATEEKISFDAKTFLQKIPYTRPNDLAVSDKKTTIQTPFEAAIKNLTSQHAQLVHDYFKNIEKDIKTVTNIPIIDDMVSRRKGTAVFSERCKTKTFDHAVKSLEEKIGIQQPSTLHRLSARLRLSPQK